MLEEFVRKYKENTTETPEAIQTSAGISREIAARIAESNSARISGGFSE